MAYFNISGTTKPSFKIGPNGVLLSSTAVQVGNSYRKYLITNQLTDNSEAFRIAYEDPDRPIYDTFVSSSEISAIQTNNGAVILNLKSGGSITLNSTMYVSGPNSATDGAVALFDGTSGKVLKDSARPISDTIDDTDSTVENNLVSQKAVTDYVGVLSNALQARLSGLI